MNISGPKTVFRYYSEKLLAILRLKSVVAGLEISDVALRLAYFDGKAWSFHGLRLAPGVMEGGVVKDYKGLVAALKDLRSGLSGKIGEKRRVSVVASISSISVFSQVFSLPIVEGENLDRAIQLNVQMISPVESADAYSGWQLVGRDQDALRLEVLSAFIERTTVDDLSRALFEAGFLVIALESRALALARVLRLEGEGFDVSGSYIAVSIDGSGIDFLIIRRGQPYFEYFNPWKDVADDKGQISKESFQEMILKNLRQILNFYNQRWSDAAKEVLLSATALGDEAKKIIEDNFSMPVRFLALKLGREAGPEWYVALGCGFRGLVPRREDKELSLLGFGGEEEFRREQMVDFVSFWRLAVPASLAVLVLLFSAADLFVIQTKKNIESHSLYDLSRRQVEEIEALQGKAKNFNKLVAAIKSVETEAFSKSGFLEKIRDLAGASEVSILNFDFQSVSQPVTIRGSARSDSKIISFKNAFIADPQFESVDLPLTSITEEEGGGFSFSMSFRIAKQ